LTEDGGAHNVWAAGDTLYLGDYQGPAHSRHLRRAEGDLLAQDVNTPTSYGRQGRQNAEHETRGAIYRDGLMFRDIISGLWVRMERQTAIP
jgi:hypothetical protein